MKTIRITFKPKKVTEKLVSTISNDRARDILTRRYGLHKKNKSETLESVGQSYNITRERVRQIENHTLQTIQKSDTYKELQKVFDELHSHINAFGGVISQNDIVTELNISEDEANHLLFLLAVSDLFNKTKDNKDFVYHWYTDKETAMRIQKTLNNVANSLEKDMVLSENRFLELFKSFLDKEKIQYPNDETLLKWLSLSKQIDRNPLGEWGLASSPSVKVKGMRDMAYLTLKRHGSPLHFSEVAEHITQLFNRKAHVATTHNELIKDPRFVLVGRGLYALSEWGYSEGVVKDVIKQILKENGPLSKKDIIERVKRERYVKDNTIMVNLQDMDTFSQLLDGTYTLSE